jgi:hypothetical protein
VYKGVSCSKARHKWYAKCYYQGERIWLGYFDSEIEAARAYDRKAVELLGEFARLNFPREWPPERRAQVYAQRQEKQGKSDKAKAKSKKAKRRRRGEAPGTRDERLEYHLQAAQDRVNAALPTPKPQAPGQGGRRRAKKTSARAGTQRMETKNERRKIRGEEGERGTHDEVRTGRGRKAWEKGQKEKGRGRRLAMKNAGWALAHANSYS